MVEETRIVVAWSQDGEPPLPVVLDPTGSSDPRDDALVVRRNGNGWIVRVSEDTGARPLLPDRWVEIGRCRLRLVSGSAEDLSFQELSALIDPELRIEDAGDGRETVRPLPLREGGQYIVGRSQAADIHLADRRVSRRHMRLFARDGRIHVEDLGSRWGTVVNDEPLDAPRALESGDTIRIGRSTIRFVNPIEELSRSRGRANGRKDVSGRSATSRTSNSRSGRSAVPSPVPPRPRFMDRVRDFLGRIARMPRDLVRTLNDWRTLEVLCPLLSLVASLFVLGFAVYVFVRHWGVFAGLKGGS